MFFGQILTLLDCLSSWYQYGFKIKIVDNHLKEYKVEKLPQFNGDTICDVTAGINRYVR